MVKVEEEIEWVSVPDDLISEASSFLGDAKTKAKYEKRAASYNPRRYWEIHDWNLQCIAAQEKAALNQGSQTKHSVPQGIKRKREDAEVKPENAPRPTKIKTDQQSAKFAPSPSTTASTASATSPAPAPAELYNRLEGHHDAWQLNETIPNFLDRLRPSDPNTASIGPWIWISNPHSTPNDTLHDTGGFMQSAYPILEKLRQRRAEFEEKYPDKIPSSITRLLKPDRDRVEADIIRLAKSHNVTTGKWMLFPSPHDVDAVWSKIATGVLEGRLGCTAKVATYAPDEKPYRLICVYTEDFSDVDDVKRVLLELKEMGYVGNGDGTGARGGTLYYKCDAYTHLDIVHDNEYKLKASMYNSRDMLGQGTGKRKA
jgi:hypothetical protein